MGTRSMIGFWDADTGVVVASYCHYDGYIHGGVGETLLNSYNTDDQAWLVAGGGYLSFLDDNYANSRAEAAHNDRPSQFGSVKQYLDEGFDHAGAKYLYLWDGEAWFVAGGVEDRFTAIEEFFNGPCV